MFLFVFGREERDKESVRGENGTVLLSRLRERANAPLILLEIGQVYM